MKGVDENKNVIFMDKTDDFVFSIKANSLLIQTDKPIYQQSQTGEFVKTFKNNFSLLIIKLKKVSDLKFFFLPVKFRIFCLSSEMKPLNHSVTYKIFNPNRDIIMIKKHQNPVKGVVSSELELHSESKKGFWMIAVKDEVTVSLNQKNKCFKYKILGSIFNDFYLTSTINYFS